MLWPNPLVLRDSEARLGVVTRAWLQSHLQDVLPWVTLEKFSPVSSLKLFFLCSLHRICNQDFYPNKDT